MKTSQTKFVTLYLVSAFAFQFISNSLLGPEIRLFPADGNWFPGAGSPIPWQSTVSIIIYPVKILVAGPLSLLFKEPDPAPPILVFAFALYQAAVALIFSYLLAKINIGKNTS